jgi:hypothetical protein
MRGRFYSIAIAGLLLAPVFSTMQAQIVDQSNYVNLGVNAQSLFWNGQTFTPSASTSAGAGFNLYAQDGISGSGILTVELWSDVPSNSGATLLASGSSAFSMLAYQQSMIDVFWPAITVTPGTQYFLTMNVPVYGNYLLTTFSFNTYAGGEFWFNSSTNDTAPYTGYPCCDMTFEEFATSQVTSAPEPASMALLGTGLFGVFGAVRWRRKQSA